MGMILHRHSVPVEEVKTTKVVETSEPKNDKLKKVEKSIKKNK